MEKVILVTDKNWHDQLHKNLCSDKYELECLRISDREKFTHEICNSFSPNWIFIPHWSFMIPEEFFKNFRCVVFHMTDLPYGRGGSPLQNLIKEGHEETQMSAIKVEEELDVGDVYLKQTLSLLGTAEEIFIRADQLIEDMIVEIIEKNPDPQPQKGEVVKFSRRKPEDSTIENINDLRELFDHIRMLDAKGYPKAFLETEHFRFEFSRTSLKTDKIVADVRIFKK